MKLQFVALVVLVGIFLSSLTLWGAAHPEILLKGEVHSFNRESAVIWTYSGKVRVPRKKNSKIKVGQVISVYTSLETIIKLNQIQL